MYVIIIIVNIDDTKSWMTLNKLKLNYDKTEAMIVSLGPTVGCASVPLLDSVKNLGVTLNCHLTMKTHVSIWYAQLTLDSVALVPSVITVHRCYKDSCLCLYSFTS